MLNQAATRNMAMALVSTRGGCREEQARAQPGMLPTLAISPLAREAKPRRRLDEQPMDGGWETQPRTGCTSPETPTNGCAGHDVPCCNLRQQARGAKRIVVSRRNHGWGDKREGHIGGPPARWSIEKEASVGGARSMGHRWVDDDEATRGSGARRWKTYRPASRIFLWGGRYPGFGAECSCC